MVGSQLIFIELISKQKGKGGGKQSHFCAYILYQVRAQAFITRESYTQRAASCCSREGNGAPGH